LLARDFTGSRFLSPEAAADLLGRLAQLGIAGGAVYDALVAAAAVEHGLPLVTRDRRATETYRALDVELEILP
jgi:predicted nucleic acid-binding protein